MRTHLGLLTASILLALLFVFYIGGRLILINIVRQAEKEVTAVSNSIKFEVLQQMNSLQALTQQAANEYAALSVNEQRTQFLQKTLHPNEKGIQPQLAAVFATDGSLLEGFHCSKEGTLESIEPGMLSQYFNAECRFTELLHNKKIISGVINFQAIPYYISIVPLFSSDNKINSVFIIGSIVHGNQFFEKMTHLSHGLLIHLNEKGSGKNRFGGKPSLASGKITPVFEEHKLFAAGGQWHLGENDFEAVIPIFDIQGNEISSLSIKFPRSFSALTTIALGRLTAFVALVGIIFILPMLWLQSRIILDPLSKLEREIKDISCKYKENKIEYLNYTSNDEFGAVAHSVDTLLQELNRKSELISHNAQRQKALISSIPDCLCIFNQSQVLVSIEKQPDNAPLISGLEIHQPLSPEVFLEDSIRTFTQALGQAFERRQTIKAALVYNELSGKRRYFEANITCMDNHFALVVFRDVTADFIKREKQEQQETHATKAQQMSSLGNMAAGIAHDFNNVFMIINNTLESICDSTDPEATEAQDAAFTLRQASTRGITLVQELMTYAGQANTHMQRMNPHSLIMELHPLYKGILHPGITLEISNSENLHPVMVDTDQFWKVIVNLVKNATESIKSRRGYIKISTYNFEITKTNSTKFFSSHPLEPDKGVVFEVSDNGEGIPQTIIDRLFEPFFSTKSVGRGLGLATVFGIVDSHNGGISISSQQNNGTKFRVWLPAAPLESDIDDLSEIGEELRDDGPVSVSTLGAATALNQAGKARILIIDDDPSIIKTTALLLERMGIAAVTATTKTEAVARFRKYHSTINMVMLDAQLGNLDSVRLLAALRMINENLPVVICSGHAKEKINAMFKDAQIDGVLIKPYTLSELKAVLSQFIESST